MNCGNTLQMPASGRHYRASLWRMPTKVGIY